MKTVSLILPIHEYNDTIKEYLNSSLESVKNLKGCNKNKLLIVGPKDVIEQVKEQATKIGCPQTITLVENDDTNMFVQINKAVMACTTKYFSIIEFDDVYKDFWFEVAEKYINQYNEVSAFLPIAQMKDIKNKVTLFANEIVWAKSFTEESGFIDLASLDLFMDYNCTGGIFKTEDFISVGMLKPSLSIASWYEFLLRFTYKGKKVYVIPKNGYVHTVNRDDSMYNTTTSELSNEHITWLIETAKQEYFFDEDRKITYKEEK